MNTHPRHARFRLLLHGEITAAQYVAMLRAEAMAARVAASHRLQDREGESKA